MALASNHTVCLGSYGNCTTLAELSTNNAIAETRANGKRVSFPFISHCCKSCTSSYTCSNSRMEEQHVVDLILPYTAPPHHRAPPVFVELGGFNGIHESNTIHLQHCLGWHGVLIEAQPTAFDDLIRNRPGVVAMHSAVSVDCQAADSVAQFEASGGTSGRIHSTSKQRTKLVTVPCAPMSRLLDALSIKHISFLSLDVEGGEFQVLRSIDWSRQSVGILVVEEIQGKLNGVDFAEKNANVTQFLRTQTRMQYLFQACWHPQACDAYWVDPHFVDLDRLAERNRTYDVAAPARVRMGATHAHAVNPKCVAPRPAAVAA